MTKITCACCQKEKLSTNYPGPKPGAPRVICTACINFAKRYQLALGKYDAMVKEYERVVKADAKRAITEVRKVAKGVPRLTRWIGGHYPGVI